MSTADIGGPALGGLLVAVSGLGPILWLDLASFLVALATIRLARIPDTPVPDGGGAAGGAGGGAKPRRRLSADSVEGLRYLFARPSLRGLVIVFFTVNLTAVFGFAVMQPMILARTGDDATALAGVNVAIGVGGIVGGALVVAWGGPRNRVRGMMLGVIGMSIAAQVVMASVRTVPAWAVAVLVGAALIPIINSSMQSIVQTKVPEQLQGRVFGAVLFVSQIAAPVAMACSGPLADHVFEPQAKAGRGVAGLLAPLLGDGPGSGLAAMLLLAGVLSAVAALAGLASRSVRNIDTLIPDADGR